MIAQCMIAVGEYHKRMASASVPQVRAYCAYHGYTFMYHDELIDPTRGARFNKGAAMLLAFADGADWAMWADCDSLIMHPEIPLERFIGRASADQHMIGCAWGGRPPHIVHTGDFLLRNCEWSRAFIDAVFVQPEEWQRSRRLSRGDTNHCNAMIRALGWEEHICVLPRTEFVSIAGEPDAWASFRCHYPHGHRRRFQAGADEAARRLRRQLARVHEKFQGGRLT